MKITKAQGRACIQSGIVSAERGASGAFWPAWEALAILAGGKDFESTTRVPHDQHLLALALCAAIAGVKP